MEYIDIHTHVNIASFKDDFDAVTHRALESGVGMINIGTQYDTSLRAVEMLETYPEGVYATVGLHPAHASDCYFDASELEKSEFKKEGEVFNIEKYKKLVEHKKVVAIGECGLDYYRNPSK
jgi:TatD DNase family protein